MIIAEGKGRTQKSVSSRHASRALTGCIMDIDDKFKLIEHHFTSRDNQRRKEGKPLHHDTAHGIWGPSSMLDAYELFTRMRLDERDGFADLGSGDGRIALIASLFTHSTGIEGDAALHDIAVHAKKELLPQIPELARCAFTHGDYTREDLGKYAVLFTFADHTWDAEFERKMLRECKGMLLSYNKIFLPSILKKGRTYWIQQLPIVSYPLNIPDEDIFIRRGH